jgi:hypothetical protein
MPNEGRPLGGGRHRQVPYVPEGLVSVCPCVRVSVCVCVCCRCSAPSTSCMRPCRPQVIAWCCAMSYNRSSGVPLHCLVVCLVPAPRLVLFLFLFLFLQPPGTSFPWRVGSWCPGRRFCGLRPLVAHQPLPRPRRGAGPRCWAPLRLHLCCVLHLPLHRPVPAAAPVDGPSQRWCPTRSWSLPCWLRLTNWTTSLPHSWGW